MKNRVQRKRLEQVLRARGKTEKFIKKVLNLKKNGGPGGKDNHPNA